jgi:hypothetical protein
MSVNSTTQYPHFIVLQIYHFHYENNIRNIKINLMELRKSYSIIL